MAQSIHTAPALKTSFHCNKYSELISIYLTNIGFEIPSNHFQFMDGSIVLPVGLSHIIAQFKQKIIFGTPTPSYKVCSILGS